MISPLEIAEFICRKADGYVLLVNQMKVVWMNNILNGNKLVLQYLRIIIMINNLSK